MPTATYHINWDALLARIVYRWHWKIMLVLVLLGAGGGLATGLVPPAWRGPATLFVAAAEGALVEVDGRSWPRPLYAGEHTITARLPDGRVAWTDVALRSGEALTITLPPGLAPPLVRPLPAAAPGMAIEQVEWANGAWRAHSTAGTHPTAETDATSLSATPTPAPSHTVAFGARGTERLSTIDAYGGLADQLRLEDRLLEAVYRPAERGFGGNVGAVEVRGWNKTSVTLPLSAELTLLRFAPAGDALLVAERTPGGEQISITIEGQARVPVVAVPGRVVRTAWSDDGRALVLHSLLGERLSLTLVRLQPTIAAATIAETDARFAASLVPLTWAPDRLLWISPDAVGEATLWEVPLQTLIPASRGQLDARAIGYRDDGTLGALWLEAGRVVVGSYRQGRLIGEAVVPDLAPSGDLAGIWHGDELLVQTGAGAWLVSLHE